MILGGEMIPKLEIGVTRSWKFLNFPIYTVDLELVMTATK